MNIPDTAVWDKAGWTGGIGKGTLAAGAAALLLIAALCFLAGRQAALENRPAGDALWIEQLPEDELPAQRAADATEAAGTPVHAGAGDSVASPPSGAAAAALPATGSAEGAYVASKNGTKYYLPSCSGAKRIKDENKVWFATAAAAAAAGYEPAANCGGL